MQSSDNSKASGQRSAGAVKAKLVKRGNIPLAENPYVISAWAVCFSSPFVY